MPERFEIYIVYKWRYINTLKFLSFPCMHARSPVKLSFSRSWMWNKRALTYGTWRAFMFYTVKRSRRLLSGCVRVYVKGPHWICIAVVIICIVSDSITCDRSATRRHRHFPPRFDAEPDARHLQSARTYNYRLDVQTNSQCPLSIVRSTSLYVRYPPAARKLKLSNRSARSLFPVIEVTL